jgi:hypothetical protein
VGRHRAAETFLRRQHPQIATTGITGVGVDCDGASLLFVLPVLPGQPRGKKWAC